VESRRDHAVGRGRTDRSVERRSERVMK
jgi:hypothetical protein